jgi:hypothetical protein
MPTASLETSDEYGGAGATAPRVSLKQMEDKIAHCVFLNLGDAAERAGLSATRPMFLMTLCVLTMDNGYVVTGQSAPASPENFDTTKGRTFAYEDAIRKLWPLEGYLLRDRLTADA